MFTGIIQAVGEIQSIIIDEEKGRVTVSVPSKFGDYELGESISVNGVCLTITEFTPNRFSVDVSAETLKRTSFRRLEVFSKVNLEKSLTSTQKISGHFVMGHVDCMGIVNSFEKKSGETLFRFTYPAQFSPYIVEKGSIAIDGISLTIFDCRDYQFSVSIIPFTLSNTNFDQLKIGDGVNLECDMIGKYVYKACESLLGKSEDSEKSNQNGL